MLLGGRYDEYYDMFFFVIEIIVEVEVGEGNSSFDLVIKEIRIEQGLCSDILMKKLGNEEEVINEGELINTLRRGLVNVQDSEEVSFGCLFDEISRRKLGRKLVFKIFFDEVNGSVKKIRLDNVNSEVKVLIMKIRGCLGERDQCNMEFVVFLQM